MKNEKGGKLVYLQQKIVDYGKGYTRTFDTRIKGYEAERLVFQQYFCCLYGIHTRTGGCYT